MSGAASTKTFQIRFAAMVGEKPFHCGTSYENVGSGGDRITPDYFRFYVSDVRLVDRSGRETPLTLDQDGTWQQKNVAFLSFERSASCANGSPQDREEITGSAPDGDYTGLRFTVGVPQALDHGDATIAQSPLNLSDMFWSWQDGYKFLRLDGRVQSRGGKTSSFVFHLGSAGCSMDKAATHCRSTNEARIDLAHFSPSSTVVVDLAELLRTSDLERGGCMMMAGQNCDPELSALGVSGSAQTVFRTR
jgi:uncharacterized repeat protein (TIGR04052 family)